jgi:glycosyltransferase involved in cell wall biosynthesis
VEKLSVIVLTWNHAHHVRRSLESVEGAVNYLKSQPDGHGVEVEVIVLDDGSDDGTRSILEESTRGRPAYHLILRGRPTNPGCLCNLGVSVSSGDPIFFLTGDDLFLENHLHECLKVFKAQGDVDFVKTQVALSDPVHPDWVAKIANSLVINLGVRRRCHDLVGGFPDMHLFRRAGDRFEHSVDVFRMIEDVFYNKKMSSVCRGRVVTHPTVMHVRHPGNPFDRQYERFQLPPGQGHQELDDLYNMRVELAKILIDHEIEGMRKRLAGQA